jgi:hypothetical protein
VTLGLLLALHVNEIVKAVLGDPEPKIFLFAKFELRFEYGPEAGIARRDFVVVLPENHIRA